MLKLVKSVRQFPKTSKTIMQARQGLLLANRGSLYSKIGIITSFWHQIHRNFCENWKFDTELLGTVCTARESPQIDIFGKCVLEKKFLVNVVFRTQGPNFFRTYKRSFCHPGVYVIIALKLIGHPEKFLLQTVWIVRRLRGEKKPIHWDSGLFVQETD